MAQPYDNLGDEAELHVIQTIRELDREYPRLETLVRCTSDLNHVLPWDNAPRDDLLRFVVVLCRAYTKMRTTNPHSTPDTIELRETLAVVKERLRLFRNSLGDGVLADYREQNQEFDDYWGEVFEFGQQYDSDPNDVGGDSDQEDAMMVVNEIELGVRHYNTLRARHEYASLIQYMQRTGNGTIIEAFRGAQRERFERDLYPFPPLTTEELSNFRV